MADLIVSTPGTCSGQPRVAGTRITVATLDACRRDGWDLMQTLAQYPSLTAEQVKAAWAYGANRPVCVVCLKPVAADVDYDIEIVPQDTLCWADANGGHSPQHAIDALREARAERDRLRALLAAYGRAVEEALVTETFVEAEQALQRTRDALRAIKAEAAKWRAWG